MKLIIMAIFLITTMAACNGMRPAEWDRTQRGAAIGGVGGAGAGALIGRDPATGAVVGGLAGAGAGALIGRELDRIERERRVVAQDPTLTFEERQRRLAELDRVERQHRMELERERAQLRQGEGFAQHGQMGTQQHGRMGDQQWMERERQLERDRMTRDQNFGRTEPRRFGGQSYPGF